MFPLFVPSRLRARQAAARAGRARAVHRRLPGRGRPRRPAGGPEGQYEAAASTGPAVLAGDAPDRAAAGAARHHPGASSTPSSPSSRTRRSSPSSACSICWAPRRRAIVDPRWVGFSLEVYLFVAAVYFAFCFAMSRYSQQLERRAGGAPPALTRGNQPRRQAATMLHVDDRARQQVVRRAPCAARHHPQGRARRADRDLRPVRVRQVDADPLRQPARSASERPDRRRRHRADRRSPEGGRGPPRRRHGVPAVQPLSAPHHPRELHAGAALGEEDAEAGGARRRDALSPPRPDPGAGRASIPASSRAASSSGWRLPARCA